VEIANATMRVRVDPARGGAVVSLLHGGREALAAGRVGNELAVYDEYPAHPEAGEGPWHLLPSGPVMCSSAYPASVQAYRSALGQRLVVSGAIGGLLRYTQTLTLWDGVDRLDCRITVDDFTGADTLLRLRWPCPVPGALPVSEVGDAVIGRGFGLLHDHDHDRAPHDRAVDTAHHPWTLDNPAHGWFGLSSCVRIRVGECTRAMSVAEVISPSGTGPDAREVMVALVRAGVTATCSAAERPRYGHLEVDSNLPDARIALGGPDENPFTAAVLAACDPAYRAELDRMLARHGRARLFVPAVSALDTVWVPDADLRGVRDLPVLIVCGDVDSLVDDLGDAVIDVVQDCPAGLGDFDSRTVALINRGVPGFAVERDGTLHASLMRSCTGWPSGTWIDPPRRTAPDGSNFQLQHWSHTFDFALVCGAGDWRDIGMPSRSAEFNHPMVCVPTGPGSGALPADGSLLTVEPAGAVALGALKVAGNPTATGSASVVDPGTVTLRLVETIGVPADVTLSSSVAEIAELCAADLLEDPRSGDVDPLALHGFQIATVRARLDAASVIDAGRPLAPEAEPAQPLYARYWLHNRGPAPLGGLPAVAHLHPSALRATPGENVRLRLSVASDCSDATVRADVGVTAPHGWACVPVVHSYELPVRGHQQSWVELTVPADAEPGHYPVRAALHLTGDVPPAWRQTVEDVCVITVGEPDPDLVRLAAEPADVVVARGGTARLTAAVASGAHGDLALEAHLISPWGTWEWIGPASLGAMLPALSTVEVGFEVSPPPWLAPGRWWALIRIGCAGRLLYTPAVAVTVT